MAVSEYDIGDTAVITATFQVAGVNTSPTTVVGSVRSPAGVVTTPAVTAGAAGVYTLPVDVTESGTWTVRVVGTGTAKAAEETTFIARRSRVLAA